MRSFVKLTRWSTLPLGTAQDPLCSSMFCILLAWEQQCASSITTLESRPFLAVASSAAMNILDLATYRAFHGKTHHKPVKAVVKNKSSKKCTLAVFEIKDAATRKRHSSYAQTCFSFRFSMMCFVLFVFPCVCHPSSFFCECQGTAKSPIESFSLKLASQGAEDRSAEPKQEVHNFKSIPPAMPTVGGRLRLPVVHTCVVYGPRVVHEEDGS